jgi:hypothetical protein
MESNSPPGDAMDVCGTCASRGEARGLACKAASAGAEVWRWYVGAGAGAGAGAYGEEKSAVAFCCGAAENMAADALGRAGAECDGRERAAKKSASALLAPNMDEGAASTTPPGPEEEDDDDDDDLPNESKGEALLALPQDTAKGDSATGMAAGESIEADSPVTDASEAGRVGTALAMGGALADPPKSEEKGSLLLPPPKSSCDETAAGDLALSKNDAADAGAGAGEGGASTCAEGEGEEEEGEGAASTAAAGGPATLGESSLRSTSSLGTSPSPSAFPSAASL